MKYTALRGVLGTSLGIQSKKEMKLSIESKPEVDEPVLEQANSASEQEELVSESPVANEVPRNPHNYSLQWLAVMIVSSLIFALLGFGSLLLIITGVLVFLDAWNAGIYKDKEKISFLNISPAAWGIAVIGLFIIGYPAYALNREKLKTKPGKRAYWYLANALGILLLLLTVVQVFIAVVSLLM